MSMLSFKYVAWISDYFVPEFFGSPREYLQKIRPTDYERWLLMCLPKVVSNLPTDVYNKFKTDYDIFRFIEDYKNGKDIPELLEKYKDDPEMYKRMENYINFNIKRKLQENFLATVFYPYKVAPEIDENRVYFENWKEMYEKTRKTFYNDSDDMSITSAYDEYNAECEKNTALYVEWDKQTGAYETWLFEDFFPDSRVMNDEMLMQKYDLTRQELSNTKISLKMLIEKQERIDQYKFENDIYQHLQFPDEWLKSHYDLSDNELLKIRQGLEERKELGWFSHQLQNRSATTNYSKPFEETPLRQDYFSLPSPPLSSLRRWS